MTRQSECMESCAVCLEEKLCFGCNTCSCFICVKCAIEWLTLKESGFFKGSCPQCRGKIKIHKDTIDNKYALFVPRKGMRKKQKDGTVVLVIRTTGKPGKPDGLCILLDCP